MILQAVNDNLRRVPYFRFLNFEIRRIEDLSAEAEITFEDRHIGNPIKEHYHGGIIASFMEAVAAIAVEPQFADQPPKPINLTVDFLRPALKGPLRTTATVTRKGRRMASVRTFAWQDHAALPVADGLYHFLLV